MRVLLGCIFSALAFATAKEAPVEKYLLDMQFGEEAPVLNPLYPKVGKVELTLGGGYAPFSTIAQGTSAQGSLTYHISDRHSFEPISYTVYQSKLTKFTKQDVAGKSSKPTGILGVDLPKNLWAANYYYTPFYSKLGLSELSVTHFDVYFGLGAGLLTSETRFPNEASGEKTQRGAGILSTGVRFLMRPMFALRFEFRDVISNGRLFGEPTLENNLSMGAGLSFFFGTFPKR